MDLNCSQCSLQFDKKVYYDLHQILVHNYKNEAKTFIRNEIKKDESVENLRNTKNRCQSGLKVIFFLQVRQH